MTACDAGVVKGINMSTIFEILFSVFAMSAASAPHEPVIIIVD